MYNPSLENAVSDTMK